MEAEMEQPRERVVGRRYGDYGMSDDVSRQMAQFGVSLPQ